MKTNISLILILCLLLGACKNGNASSQSKSETPQDTIKAIKMPAIPQMMTAPEQRADFLAKHYWDNVNFADTNYFYLNKNNNKRKMHDGIADKIDSKH